MSEIAIKPRRAAARGAGWRAGVGAILLALAAIAPAAARDPFAVDADIDGQIGRAGFGRIEDAVDTLGNAGLARLVPNYNATLPATVQVDLRGVAATAIYQRGSPILRVIVPGAGIDESFLGATRDESQELFLEWLKGRGASQVQRVLRLAARTTPIDPIAGNPSSLMNRMVAQDFDSAVGVATGSDRPGGGFGIGVRFGSFSAGGYRTQSLDLPLSYTWRISPSDTVVVDAPIAWSDTEGASAYSGNVGLIYRRQVTDNWMLQPSFRVGGAGSVDLGAGAGVWSAGLTSVLNIPLPRELRLTIGNSATFITTFPVSAGGYSVDYGLSNTVFRNGLILSRRLDLSVLDLPLSGAVFAVDTRFTGDAVFVRSYQEFGVFVSAGERDPMRLGFTWLNGERGYRGFTVNAGVQF